MIKQIIISGLVFIGIVVVVTFMFFSQQFYTLWNTKFETSIFENSYQKQNSDNEQRNLFEAQLSKINIQLQNSSLTEEERTQLESQKSFIEIRLESLNK